MAAAGGEEVLSVKCEGGAYGVSGGGGAGGGGCGVGAGLSAAGSGGADVSVLGDGGGGGFPSPLLESRHQRHSKECGGGAVEGVQRAQRRRERGAGLSDCRSARARRLVPPCWSRVQFCNACPSWVGASPQRQPLLPHHPQPPVPSASPGGAAFLPGSPAGPVQAPPPDWASPRPAPSTHGRRRWLSRSALPTLRRAPGLRPLPAWEGCTDGVSTPPPAVARRAALPVSGAPAIERVLRPDGNTHRPGHGDRREQRGTGEHLVVAPPVPTPLLPAAAPRGVRRWAQLRAPEGWRWRTRWRWLRPRRHHQLLLP